MQTERAGASSLLQLLDKLYVGGLPSAEPEAPMDQMPKPKKKLPTPEELEERIDEPSNIMGSW
jgi:hypothetical protein